MDYNLFIMVYLAPLRVLGIFYKNVSQLKLKVQERSTGKERCEEWLFLPEDWTYYLSRGRNNIFIDKNFTLLGFDTLGDPNTPDLIILNLKTRDKFWMRRAMIAEEVKEKATQVDFTIHDFRIQSYEPHFLDVEKDGVKIGFVVKMRGLELNAVATLGRFSDC